MTIVLSIGIFALAIAQILTSVLLKKLSNQIKWSEENEVAKLRIYLKQAEESRDIYKSRLNAALEDGLKLANRLDIIDPKPKEINGYVNIAGEESAWKGRRW